MAKLKLAQVPSKEQVKATLEQRLPQYKYSFRGNMVIAAKSGTVGAVIAPRKEHIIINGNFPSMGVQILFTLFMIFTGILVGLLLWLIAWKGGQDKVRDEVESVLKATYALPSAQVA